MNPPATLMFSASLLLGTTITMTSNHWVMAWTGLEINTLAIIPLISKSHHPRATEAAIKYFLVQAAASALLLFSSTINAWQTGQWDITQLNQPAASTLLTVAIAMKLGLVPFHFWFPEVLQGSSTMTALLLSTIMKLPPTIIMILVSHSLNSTLITSMAIMSAALGGWMGLNQTQVRKILAFSSISHLGWMTVIMLYSPKLSLLNLCLYIVMTTATFMIINTIKTTKLSTIMTSWAKTPTLNAALMMILLSLAGLPPLTGFLPKWLIIQELTKQEMTSTATAISLISLLSLFFYMRLAYYSTITLPPNSTNRMKQWHTNNQTSTMIAALTSMSAMILPMSPMMLTLT
uniref:NADH-ubiquinone oxidoreductase chain 2 n=1 Tax=Heliornis fulica TaxID=54369 RepID=A0A096X6T0_9GRUI|nr:NADH dehydrogenase subunit 2 [Heliornis fulica]AHA13326.1 NADH dehydrogenase subunit 2 [Heliornis fulica]